MTVTGSFAKMATVTATTRREGAVVGGLPGAMANVVVNFACFPLDPVTPETAAMMGLGNFAEILQTYCEGGLDIREGDQLLTGGVTYKVRAVGQWLWRPSGSNTLQIFLEETK